MTGAPPPVPPRPATIKAVRNGPLQIKGAFKLLDPGGEEYDLEGQRIVLLCRCGKSRNQPFCDSSHTQNGFVTEDQAACGDTEDEGAA